METREPKDNSTYRVRPMHWKEAKEVYEMIDKEGWNLTLDKFRMLHEAYPHQFYVAISQDEEIAGTMSLYPSFEGEYVLGNIVVKDGHRSRGLGRKLVEDILADNPYAVVSCTAVPGADQFYLNTGFKFTQPQQGHDIFHLVIDLDALVRKVQELDNDISVSIAPYDEACFDDLVAYDCEARGYLNTSYVAMQVKCFTVMTAKDSKGKLVGFGVAFLKHGEVVLDGLYADSDGIALRLLIGLMKAFPGNNTLKVQIPSSNLFLSTLGEVKASEKYNRYSIGIRPPTLSPLSKVYNVGDCDYTY